MNELQSLDGGDNPKAALTRASGQPEEPSEEERDGSVSAVRIGEMLASDAKAERERAYGLLETCEDVSVATQCVGTLADILRRRKAENVNADEWQRAMNALVRMHRR